MVIFFCYSPSDASAKLMALAKQMVNEALRRTNREQSPVSGMEDTS